MQAAIAGSPLALSTLGRGLPGPTSIKHNIKRVDRLLGNHALHAELPMLYQALIQQYLVDTPMPLIIIDWSDLTTDRRWQLLRASIAVPGRSVTLYEQVHPLTQSMSPAVHAAFLEQLAAMLPEGSVPILLTDAGFRGSWFKLVNRMGWHWIGRIRNRDMVKPDGSDQWAGCKTLYAKATSHAKALGRYDYVRCNPVSCNLVVVKRACKGRRRHNVQGKVSRAHHSLKNARRQREPWLLAVDPELDCVSAGMAVKLYGKRMQIEEAFRDLKSGRFGLGFNVSRSKDGNRIGVLLLIAALASFALRMIGEAATQRDLARQCQSNTRRSRAVLSVITLARQVVSSKRAIFTRAELKTALCTVRTACSAPCF